MQTIVEFEDIKDSELKLKIYEIAFRIKREFRISEEEFEKALEYFSYIKSCGTTIDNIINRNELTLREFETLMLLLKLDKYAKQKNAEIVSITTLLKSVRIED
jgi:hypothetical protein